MKCLLLTLLLFEAVVATLLITVVGVVMLAVAIAVAVVVAQHCNNKTKKPSVNVQLFSTVHVEFLRYRLQNNYSISVQLTPRGYYTPGRFQVKIYSDFPSNTYTPSGRLLRRRDIQKVLITRRNRSKLKIF